MATPELENLQRLLKNSSHPRHRATFEALIKKLKEQQAEVLGVSNSVCTPNVTIFDISHPQTQSAEVLTKCKPSLHLPALASAPGSQRKASAQFQFTAIGIIQGEVVINNDKPSTITIDGKVYQLKCYSPQQKLSFRALKLEIKNTGSNFQRLKVYPRITHFPDKEKSHNIHFELVGFEGHAVQDKIIANDLKDFEFNISGLWQFIPVCRIPCVSIFKNYSEDRKLFLDKLEPLTRVRFLRASHIPLLWRNSPVKPFHFNPKVTKEEQGRAMFIRIKARFNPERNQFEFIEQLGKPLADAPKFLKASKKDKAKQRR